MTKELHLTMTLRNNRVLARRKELGLSAKGAAERCGVAYNIWLDFERMRASPYGRSPGFGGRIGLRPQAQRIADGLGVTVDWLWPEAVLAVSCPTMVKELDAQDLRPALTSAQIAALPVPADEQIESVESNVALQRWLSVCTPREERCVRLRFGFDDGQERTFEDIGAEFDISHNRARQIFERAMWKIRKAQHSESVLAEHRTMVRRLSAHGGES